jgi:excisionase family DNA binding protein
LVTVTEAAKRLGLTPWDVMRLIEAGEIESVVCVDAASLDAMKEKSS